MDESHPAGTCGELFLAQIFDAIETAAKVGIVVAYSRPWKETDTNQNDALC